MNSDLGPDSTTSSFLYSNSNINLQLNIYQQIWIYIYSLWSRLISNLACSLVNFLFSTADLVTDSWTAEIKQTLLKSRESSGVILFVSFLLWVVYEYASLNQWRKILPRKKSCLVFKKNIWTGKMHCTMKDSSNLQTHELMSGISLHPYLYVTAMAPTYDKSLLAEFWKSNSSAVNIK